VDGPAAGWGTITTTNNLPRLGTLRVVFEGDPAYLRHGISYTSWRSRKVQFVTCWKVRTWVPPMYLAHLCRYVGTYLLEVSASPTANFSWQKFC
jgi:hypothetical protein